MKRKEPRPWEGGDLGSWLDDGALDHAGEEGAGLGEGLRSWVWGIIKFGMPMKLSSKCSHSELLTDQK